MSNNKKIIFLRNNVLENNEISDYDIATYIALRNIYAKGNEKLLITTDTILYSLYDDSFTTLSKRAKDNFRKAIEHLGELGIIEIIKNYGRGTYAVNMESLLFNPSADNPFTTIEEEDVRKILSLECKEDKLKLLRYFIMLMRTVNGKDGVGFMSIDHLAKLSKISRQSVFTYNKILEDNQIVYMYHHDMIYSTGNDAISSLPNHYGRYADKNKIEAYALGYEDDKKKEITDITRKKKKAKENKAKENVRQSNAQDIRYGIAIGTKKETKNDGYNEDDEDDIVF